MPPIGLLIVLAILALAVIAVRNAMRTARERRELQTRHPDEPWMWRPDWAERAVRDAQPLKSGFLWAFGILWMSISLPVFFFGRLPDDAGRYFLLLFPTVGVCVLIAAAYQTFKRRKYGVSMCRIERVPIALGSTLRGEIQTKVTEVPPQGFQLQLSNIRRIITGSGKNRSTKEHVLWQEEQTAGSGRAIPNPDGTRVPFQFSIPRDGEPVDDSNPRDSILWRLAIRADVPGIDYSTRFELPVFRTADSVVESNPFPIEPASWQPSKGITLGQEIIIRPSRPLGDWFGYLFFLALWFGVVALMARSFTGPPRWIVAIFAVIGSVVLIAALDFLLGSSTIRADGSGITARRSWLFLRRERTIPTNELASITAHTGMTQGGRAFYDIRATLHDGRTITLAKSLREKRDAEMVAARLLRQLGR